jgi:hypothetical protein
VSRILTGYDLYFEMIMMAAVLRNFKGKCGSKDISLDSNSEGALRHLPHKNAQLH